MQAVMARIRLTIDVEDSHKRAFLARAQFEGKSPQELFEKLVAMYCPEDLQRARAMLEETGEKKVDDDDEKKATKKSGRK